MLAEALDKALQHTLYLHRIEALAPAVAQLERDAGRMFILQSYDVLTEIYQADLSEATQEEKDDRRLALILAAIAAALAARIGKDVLILRPGLLAALTAAVTQSALAKYGITGDLRSVRAQQYLIEHGADLVKGINDYTRERMGRLIAQGLAKGQSVEDIAGTLMTSFDDMGWARARRIAITEANKAWSYAELESAYDMEKAGYGMVKEWILGPMHPRYDICDHNNEQGAIPVHNLFSSGDMAPPQHPNCGCGLITYPADGNQPWGSQVNGQTPLMPFGFDQGDQNANR